MQIKPSAVQIKKVLRTVEVRLPPTANARWRLESRARRTLRRPFDDDFKVFAKYRKSRPVVVDGGANHGQSIDAFQMTLQSPSIVAFEPNTHLADALKARYGKDSVEIHAQALGEVAGAMVLFVPQYQHHVFDGLASLIESEARDWLEGHIYGFDKAKLKVLELPSSVATLDSFALAPDIIKLDLQGYEFPALKGGSETLRQNEPVLLIENPQDDVVAFLAGFGYEAFGFDGSVLRRGGRVSRNTFFVTPRRHGEFEAGVVA